MTNDAPTLYGAAQVAALYNITPRRANAIIAAAHKRLGIGRKVGNAWVLTEAEAQLCKPGEPGRPRVAGTPGKGG